MIARLRVLRLRAARIPALRPRAARLRAALLRAPPVGAAAAVGAARLVLHDRPIAFLHHARARLANLGLALGIGLDGSGLLVAGIAVRLLSARPGLLRAVRAAMLLPVAAGLLLRPALLMAIAISSREISFLLLLRHPRGAARLEAGHDPLLDLAVHQTLDGRPH